MTLKQALDIKRSDVVRIKASTKRAIVTDIEISELQNGTFVDIRCFDGEENRWYGYRELLAEQAKLPPVTPKGKWVKVKNGRGGHECNICHMYAPSYQNGDEHLSRFCPNCGAKMEDAM